ncbi:MAG: chemotaxis protein CheD [Candidatus Riflebacteria bacterium]|nr:chemotaxis protein CheD [Candidatus Riflebacteria bacterium]
MSHDSADRPADRAVGGEPPGSPVDRKKAYLHPGQLFVSDQPHAVTTVLGSCVSVCIWDPKARTGGLTHYVLPSQIGPLQEPMRFGDRAIPRLIAKLVVLGAQKNRLTSKVFGGMCRMAVARGGQPELGRQNVDLALQLLEQERIPVVARDVLGSHGRKLIFFTDDGTAWVKTLG